jgi:hypothetical protein
LTALILRLKLFHLTSIAIPSHTKVVSPDQEYHQMQGSTGIAKLVPRGWECRPEQR